MKRMTTLVVVAVAAIGLMASTARAATISLVPGTVPISVGDSFTLDIVISDFAGEIVSAYDLDVLYDSTALVANSVVFGSSLGDESFFEVLNAFDLSTAGVVDLAQLSLLSDADLLTLQGGAGSLVLATLSFTAIEARSTSIGFSFDEFNDVKGLNGLELEIAAIGARTSVVSDPIPEPRSLLLLAVGMLVVAPAVLRSLQTRRAEVKA